MKRLSFILIISALFAPLLSIAYTSPGTPQGFVNDFADILSEEQENNLESKLTLFEQESSNEIAVVTVATIGEESIEEYAVKLFEEWGIGKAENDNGILLLVAVEDREMRIEVGYGLEGSVPDIVAGQIIRDVLTPNFRDGNFYFGIDSAIDALSSATKGEYVSAAPQINNEYEWVEIIIFGLFFVLPWLGSILSLSKSWWGGGIVGFITSIVIGIIFTTSLFFIAAIILIPLGLLFDYIVSKAYAKAKTKGGRLPWWAGGGGIGGGHGGFGGGGGGFGGGSSGGGGASGRW